MSTFSSWQGPGDFAGDLSIIYNAVRDAETAVTNLTNQLTTFKSKVETSGHTVPSGTSTQQEIEQLQNSLSATNTAISALNNVWIKDAPTGFFELKQGGKARVSDLSADRVTAGKFGVALFEASNLNIQKTNSNGTIDTFIETINRGANAVRGELHSAVDWLLTGQKLTLKRLVNYDAVEFRSSEQDGLPEMKSGSMIPVTPRNMVTQASSVTAGTATGAYHNGSVYGNEAILGIFIKPTLIGNYAEKAAKATNVAKHAGGSATLYISINDTVKLDAVVNINAQWTHDSGQQSNHQDDDTHGAITASFSYSIEPASQMKGVRFSMYKGTTYGAHAKEGSLLGTDYASGVECLIVTVSFKETFLKEGLFGNVWWTGYNFKRWVGDQVYWIGNPSSPNDHRPTWEAANAGQMIYYDYGNLICSVESKPGDGENGACHGILQSDVLINNLEVYADATFDDAVKIKNALSVGNTTNLNTMLANYPRSPGGIVGTCDLVATGYSDLHSLTVQEDAKFAKDVNIDGNLGVRGETSLVKLNTDQIHSMPEAGQPQKQYVQVKKETGTHAVEEFVLGDGTVHFTIKSEDRPTLNQTKDRYDVGSGSPRGQLALIQDIPVAVMPMGTFTAMMTEDEWNLLNAANILQPLPLENGGEHRWRTDDTILVKGYGVPLSATVTDPFATWTTKLYTCINHNPNTGTGTFGTGVMITPPSKHDSSEPDAPYVSLEWTALQYIKDTGLWSYAWGVFNPNVLYDPNDPTNPDATQQGRWLLIDLHMEYYRTIGDQNRIDVALAHIAGMQPDWLEDDPIIHANELPDGSPISGDMPNPRYINNKPYLQPSILDGGDWNTQVAYQCIIEGGDWTAPYLMPQVTPPAQGLIQTETLRNASIKVARGDFSSMPKASVITAYTERFAYDYQDPVDTTKITHLYRFLDLGDPTIADTAGDPITAWNTTPRVAYYRGGNRLIDVIEL